MLYRIEVGLHENQPDPAASNLLKEMKSLGVAVPEKVRTVRLFWLEADFDAACAQKLARVVKYRRDRLR